MNYFPYLLLGLILLFFGSRLLTMLKAPRISAAEAARLSDEGKAVLVDVREPAEWSGGVAQPAKLLSLSDLNGGRKQWSRFLQHHDREQTILLYCQSGARSAAAAGRLTKEGYTVANVGGFGAWRAAGLPTRKP